MFWPGNLSSRYTGTAQKQPFLNGRVFHSYFTPGIRGVKSGWKSTGNAIYFFLKGESGPRCQNMTPLVAFFPCTSRDMYPNDILHNCFLNFVMKAA